MLQMIITRLSEGLRSSSWVWSIQVDLPGTRETVPDRFRLVPEDFLMKILLSDKSITFLTKNEDFFEKVSILSKNAVFIQTSIFSSKSRPG